MLTQKQLTTGLPSLPTDQDIYPFLFSNFVFAWASLSDAYTDRICDFVDDSQTRNDDCSTNCQLWDACVENAGCGLDAR